MMTFERLLPPPSLRDHVQYFWTLDSSGIEHAPRFLGPLADGCPGMIFQPAEAGVFCEGPLKPFPQVFLYGQTIERTSIQLLGTYKTVGVCFYPNALTSVFGFDADAITDTCLDADLLAAPLLERLLNAVSTAEVINVLSAWLLARIRQTDQPIEAVTRYALRQIIGSGGRLSLPVLQRSLNLSERSLERRFKQHVGVAPKLFTRVCQFQFALQQLKSNRYARLSDVAYDNGYADQSHFIRAFRAFTGVAPHQWQKGTHAAPESLLALMD